MYINNCVTHCVDLQNTVYYKWRIVLIVANARLSLGSRRGFIIRMRLGDAVIDPVSASHTVRLRQRNVLGPASDGHQYSVVHVTGYIKNWPPGGKIVRLSNWIELMVAVTVFAMNTVWGII